MTRALCLYVTDTGGAPEFRRQALAFAKMYGCEAVPFKPWDCRSVETALTQRSGQWFDLVAFFCHGFRGRLMTGHASDAHVQQVKYHSVDALAGAIDASCNDGVVVLLDACSTGSDSVGIEGDGGFADLLRDRLGAHACNGGWVDAHNTAGNTATNPFVRRFKTDGDGALSPGSGGAYIIEPHSALWAKWVAALKTDFRFRFPLMDVSAIRAELSAA